MPNISAATLRCVLMCAFAHPTLAGDKVIDGTSMTGFDQNLRQSMIEGDER
jgi:hypothetical protein